MFYIVRRQELLKFEYRSHNGGRAPQALSSNYATNTPRANHAIKALCRPVNVSQWIRISDRSCRSGFRTGILAGNTRTPSTPLGPNSRGPISQTRTHGARSPGPELTGLDLPGPRTFAGFEEPKRRSGWWRRNERTARKQRARELNEASQRIPPESRLPSAAARTPRTPQDPGPCAGRPGSPARK